MKKGEITGDNISEQIALLSISAMDGRYSKTAERLNEYLSEYALIKYRVFVEIKWLIFFAKSIDIELEDVQQENLMSIYSEFSIQDALKLKEIEKTTKHDVKSVEYFLREKLTQLGMENLISFVHIGCTSEDITNLAYAMMIKDTLNNVWVKEARKLIDILREKVGLYKDIAMLAHTHGQPATPTTVGKEILVYLVRMDKALSTLHDIDILGKFNGATGNYSAISFAYPDKDWDKLSEEFVTFELGLEYNPITTQIESHDYMCRIFNEIRLFNNILLDLDRDMWLYISMDYFKQIPIAGEVGSSTMPHKVNPINFENSESNIITSNALLSMLSDKLPISRLQRDLSDSSSQRNIGSAISHSLLSMEQTIIGLKKVDVNVTKIKEDLNNKWEILAEPIQTILRKYGIENAYEALKELTRGKQITKEILREYITGLDISISDMGRLMELTPETYVGYAVKLVENFNY